MNKEQYIDSLKCYTRFEAEGIYTREKARVIKESDKDYFVLLRGKRNRGYRYDRESFLKFYNPTVKDANYENMAWHNRIRKALNLIDTTGLWKGSETEEELRNLLNVSYADLKEIREIRLGGGTVYENGYPKMDQKRIAEYVAKYPFMFEICNGFNMVKFSYITEFVDLKFKSMYFGSENAYQKELIRHAISERENYRTPYIRTNYDVRFELKFNTDDGIPRAWYSEEYKDCGNGHYYIALSENCAVFCEND